MEVAQAVPTDLAFHPKPNSNNPGSIIGGLNARPCCCAIHEGDGAIRPLTGLVL